MATRWAICGTGRIAHDFCTCLKHLPETEHKIVAVAASSQEKASKFATEYGAQESYGCYEALIHLDNIDVIYIATIHTLHVETCLLFINAGKNVLCGKPMALSLAGCKKVLSAAKEKGVLFIEGTWSRFSPVYDFIREQVASGVLGEVKMIQANFSVNSSTPRVHRLDLGGGALMDIGLYTVQATNMIFRGVPERINMVGSKSDSGTDHTGAFTLKYSEDRFACLSYSSQMARGTNFLIIRGTKGIIKIPEVFWSPTEIILANGEVRQFPFPEITNAKFKFENSAGLVYEVAHVRECLLNGWKESPKMPHEDSETIMTILQECLIQLDINYHCL